MARLSDSTLRTVRFYEAAGIVRPQRRARGRRRLFHLRELHRLQLATELRASGLSLRQIRQLLGTKAEFESASKAAVELQVRLTARARDLRELAGRLERTASSLEEASEGLLPCVRCSRCGEDFAGQCHDCDTFRDITAVHPALGALWDASE